MASPTDKLNIAAIVVTYKPDLSHLKKLMDRLAMQVDRIFVIDNGSKLNELKHTLESGNKVFLTELPLNSGIAYAQNVGIALARESEVSHVLLMDQDSLPAENMVAELVQNFVIASQADSGNIAGVGPARVDTRNGDKSYFMTQVNGLPKRFRSGSGDMSGQLAVEATYLISSGTIIPLKVLDDVGDMREEYFIDRVDTEWCFRARAKGYRLLGVSDAELYHSLGDRAVRAGLLKQTLVPWHSPVRHYYVFRNTLLMLKDVEIPFVWQLHAVWRLFQVGTFSLIFAPHRLRRLRLICLGLFHGLKSVRGRLDEGSLTCERVSELSDKVDLSGNS